MATPTDPDNLHPELLQETFDAIHDTGVEAVVAEVRYGDETWSSAAGDRNLTGFAPAEPTDRVRVASVTKSMISTVVLQLEAEGHFDLEDTVEEHLPSLLPYEEDITLRQLLQHTSGLGEYLNYIHGEVFADEDWDQLNYDKLNRVYPDEHISLVTQDPLHFEPGTDWLYSNTGYTVLGLLIEEVTGTNLSAVLEERIFQPVGMTDTYLPWPHESIIVGDHLGAYFATGDEEAPFIDMTFMSFSQWWAAGGVVSTMGDVNEFFRATADGTLLTEEQYADATDPTGEQGEEYGYGLGYWNANYGCPSLPDGIAVGHTGDGLGHHTLSMHSPDGERQFTVTHNVDVRYGPYEEVAETVANFGVHALCSDDINDIDVEGLAAELINEIAAATEASPMGPAS